MTFPVRTIFLIALLTTSGCVSLLPETAPPQPRYHISSLDTAPLTGSKVEWSLVIEDPRASRVYDTTRIAVSSAPGKIEYYANAQWADRAPRLFQTALLQSFEDSGRIINVGDRAALPIGDLALLTDIRSFTASIQDGEVNAMVAVYVRLTDGKGNIHDAQLFEANEKAASDGPDDLVVAIDLAVKSVLLDIANWTFETAETANAIS